MIKKFDSIITCVRIPKSGSSSLMKMLNQLKLQKFFLGSRPEPENENSTFQYLRYLRSAVKKNFSSYRKFSNSAVDLLIKERIKNGDLLIGGHFTNNYVKQNITFNSKIITLVRNPLKRCVSEYVYYKQGYLRKPFYLRWDSGTISQRCGQYDFDGYLSYLLENKSRYGNVVAKYVGWDPSDDFSAFEKKTVLCWGRLENSERFEKSASNIFERTMKLERSNSTGSSDILLPSRHQIKMIESIYDLDMELYESIE